MRPASILIHCRLPPRNFNSHWRRSKEYGLHIVNPAARLADAARAPCRITAAPHNRVGIRDAYGARAEREAERPMTSDDALRLATDEMCAA